MRHVWFIRHGESEANAGMASNCPASIVLTPLGHSQARSVAQSFDQTPGQIIVSSYTRTQQTAAPTVEKFSDVPVKVWDTHEFTYLNSSKLSGTTFAERKPFVDKYWSRWDPLYSDGGDAESFAGFCNRGDETLTQLLKTENDLTFIFSHAYFIKMMMMKSKNVDLVSTSGMKQFRQSNHDNLIGNGEILKATIDDRGLKFID